MIQSIASYVADKILYQILKRCALTISNPSTQHKERLSRSISNTVDQFEKMDIKITSSEERYSFWNYQLLFDHISRYILFNDGSVDIIAEPSLNRIQIL